MQRKYNMYQKLTAFFVLVTMDQVLAAGRGGQSGFTSEEEYWPKPRLPLLASSQQVVTAQTEVGLVEVPYSGKTGPMLQYYQKYAIYANRSIHKNYTEMMAHDGPVCLNYENFNNGSYIGAFTCPMPHEPRQYTGCCGQKHADFCCLPLAYEISLANERLAGTLVFIGIVAAVFTVGAMLWNCAGMTKAQLLTMCGDDIEDPKGGV